MASSSSSSSVVLQSKYDVFLSFRGEDTRDNFTSHLYAALCKKQIQTFIDDDGLERGDDISPALLKAIEESSISIVIFSKHYAFSKWCLDELIRILECKKMNGQTVIPVFYQVSPSDVRKQTGSFEDAFIMHEKCLKGMTGKVQKWKDALTEAANLSGWDSMVIRTESKLVDKIVSDVLNKLDAISAPSDCEGLVGIESKVEDIKSCLCIGSLDFRVVGIWGMGGIGKTTIAEAVFNQIRDQFQGCCFVRNVREDSEKTSDGLVRLKEQLLSTILGGERINIGTLNVIPTFIKHRVQRTKILVVLDDVSNSEQLKILMGGIDQFGLGSRVLITTRDSEVLWNFKECEKYAVKGLNYQQAFELFSNCAFKQNCPLDDFMVLSEKIVDYAKGNPLALKVLGYSLCQSSKSDWESALCKLNKISNPQIYNVLKTSYDALDHEEQNIFLDIACFFKGDDRNHAMRILDGCYFSLSFGLNALIGKSLITISYGNKLEMHDLLQEMGREIVRQENIKDPGKRSRLWYFEDVYRILRDKKGTDAVEGLFLDMSKITDLHLSSRAFENMSNLKFLKFYVPDKYFGDVVNINKVHLPEGLNYLPDELRYLHWHGYPLEALPSNFSPKNLVELNLQDSNVDEKLWLEAKHGSKQSYPPQPEHCQSLLDGSLCIQYLTNLQFLNLSGCESIRSFPSNIHFRSLITLRLSGCINLTKFPQISGKIKELYLNRTAIDEVPSSIACLTKLNKLQLWKCKRIKRISSSIYKLTSLHGICISSHKIGKCHFSSFIAYWKEIRYLTLGYCDITEIPEDLLHLSALEFLDLRGNKFKSLPTSMKQLTQLRWLYLTECSELQSIPELPLALTYLEAGGCSQLQLIQEPRSNLEELAESELEIEFESKSMYFIFTNCLKLNQITDNNNLTDSGERIQHMAALVLRLYYAKVSNKLSKISFCLPGTEIPKWFSHQSSASSITIELPQHWCNRRFMGFAVSAVLAFEKNVHERRKAISVSCSYHFRDNNANSAKFYWDCRVTTNYFPVTSNDLLRLFESNHIALGYSPCCMNNDVEGNYTSASFKFRVFKRKERGQAKGVKLKCCGVHPLYAQSNISSIQTFAATNEDSAETILKECEKIRKFDDEQKVEPYPKRICRN